MNRGTSVTRTTKETDITVTIAFGEWFEPEVNTGLPFLDHMLSACAFHGRFGLRIAARGDLEVDAHHLVEDTGLVLGSCLAKLLEEGGPVRRFGHAVIPMDEALSETTIDVCGRPTLRYNPRFPQDWSGDFPMWLFREFFLGLATNARIALHLDCRYGENAHHMIEALFKSLGKAIAAAYAPAGDAGMSTKGVI
jgi:imidazoleglycerol-phosphate dehydratase